MPIFEYQCRKCGKTSEFLEGVTQEKAKKKCSHCGSVSLAKVFSKMNISVMNTPASAQKCRDICGKPGSGAIPPCAGGMCQ